jgi:2-C-methyl-D-erythritol 4-phosphate cytidylyltransferase
MTPQHDLSQKVWAVIPAAGAGRRMGADKPKQYLELLGKTVIEHTLDRFFSNPLIAGVAVSISHTDRFWNTLNIDSDKTLIVAEGGRERGHSVLNALHALSSCADSQDWVLVHDAARPCVRQADVDKLITELSVSAVGGILAVPVHDTIKRSGMAMEIEQTIDRRHLWHAQTPQMFRLQTLKEALHKALEDEFVVTDEASAMENAGLKPKLVEGHTDNIKITRPEDLALAEYYLKRRTEER